MTSKRNPCCVSFFLAILILFITVSNADDSSNGLFFKTEVESEGKTRQESRTVKESWAYVTVRSKAHMFYWLYETTHSSGYQTRPLILWLQGGPGGSGTGFGNFDEIGPLDINLKPRNSTWLQTASLLFVDNPVGAGFSYVDDESAFTTNLAQISADLLVLMKEFIRINPVFQKTPFYIFSESYGGKMTTGFSAVLHKAIKEGEIAMNFKGLALGDSWISPVSYTDSWGPYLYATSIVSYSGLMTIAKGAKTVSELVKRGEFREASAAWGSLETIVQVAGYDVNFYNILDWSGSELSARKSAVNTTSHTERLFNRHVRPMHSGSLSDLMNGPIRKKLEIIPSAVTWGGQSGQVFVHQSNDFMRNVASTVNELVNARNLTVVVYNGQLDLICNTLGTEHWFFSSLDIANRFKKAPRKSYTCNTPDTSCFFGQELDNVQFYWILKAGHMVPKDNGPAALAMVNKVIG